MKGTFHNGYRPFILKITTVEMKKKHNALFELILAAVDSKENTTSILKGTLEFFKRNKFRVVFCREIKHEAFRSEQIRKQIFEGYGYRATRIRGEWHCKGHHATANNTGFWKVMV